MIPNTDPPKSYAPLLAAIVEPIVTWVHAQRGRKAAFVQAMKAADPVLRRSTVEAWLTPDPAARTQPLLGYGLLAQQVAKKLGVYRLSRHQRTTPNQDTTHR